MKISFVIPAHNEEHTIRPCLEAILREIERVRVDAEIIVVDNASTDRTKEVAEAIPGVKVVSEIRKGIVWARNAGFTVAKGELVANIDADTELPRGWLTRVLSAFSKNPRLVCFSGPQVYSDAPPLLRLISRLWWYVAYCIYLVNRFVLRIGSMVMGGNFVVEKEALEKAGGFDTSIEFYGEDTDIAKRLFSQGDVVFSLSHPIYASGRRMAEEGVLATGGKYALNYFWVTFFGKPFPFASKDIRKSPTHPHAKL